MFDVQVLIVHSYLHKIFCAYINTIIVRLWTRIFKGYIMIFTLNICLIPPFSGSKIVSQRRRQGTVMIPRGRFSSPDHLSSPPGPSPASHTTVSVVRDTCRWYGTPAGGTGHVPVVRDSCRKERNLTSPHDERDTQTSPLTSPTNAPPIGDPRSPTFRGR